MSNHQAPQAQVRPEVETSPIEISDYPVLPVRSRRRRATIVDCLDSYEEVARYRARHLTEAQAEATWSAVWQLRLDVIAALERCEAGERAARWVRDE